jgi:GNAT superfamily N-acetyltransferase
MRSPDIHILDKIYECASVQTKIYFHPGIFSSEFKYVRNKLYFLLSRACLIISTNKYLRSVLITLLAYIPIFAYIPVVATHGDHYVGFAFLKFSKTKKEASLGIFVPEPYQGRGFGKALLQTLVQEAMKNNLSRIYLHVLDINLKARRLYESFGFKYTGRRLFEIWNDKVYVYLEMARELSYGRE